jgi:hypothetical protein
MALWLLWKQHSKAQRKLLQQQQEADLQQQHHQHQGRLEDDVALEQLSLEAATAVTGGGHQPEQHQDLASGEVTAGAAAASQGRSCRSGRQHSRDEVLQMLAEGRLTGGRRRQKASTAVALAQQKLSHMTHARADLTIDS